MRSAKSLVSLILLASSSYTFGKISNSKILWKNESAEVKIISTNSNLKEYELKTTLNLRDNIPESKTIRVKQNSNFPQINSNSSYFDSLFALSINELVQNSVEKITDHSFSTSDCHCFETGKKWNYVWTRDVSYSAHLALAGLSQQRTKNSLLFKISKRRGQTESSTEIVQDTGTGGSWPISTDRVVWALAANELLNHLQGAERIQFLNTAYIAIKNTVNNDRIAIYDAKDGLYTGEQSFLDWREQTYPQWVKENVVHIGMSKSLSTNITHYIALDTLANFALELGQVKEFKEYNEMAIKLKIAINKEFWDAHKGLYRTYITTYLAPDQVNKYDLLGNSLAVLFNIAETNDQKNLLINYPMTKAGASVIWPQDQEAAIYHNRGSWPFVTQYALLAAKKSKQAKIYNHLFDSMVRGAALNLSNMENFEFLSLHNWIDDGGMSGPVVNSQRQLWSVAGLLSTYLNGIIGKEVGVNQIKFSPFITAKIRNTILKGSQKIQLNNLLYKGRKINIEINLPAETSNYSDGDYYSVAPIILKDTDLKAISNLKFDLNTIKDSNENFDFLNIDSPYNLSEQDFEFIFAPKTPILYPIVADNGKAHLYFNKNTSRNIKFDILKNGKIIAEDLTSDNYIDPTQNLHSTACYTVITKFSNGNKSLPSEPNCFWPKGAVETISINQANSNHKSRASYDEIPYLKKWGDKNEVIEFKNRTVATTGTYALQLNYNNLGQISTGITATVKKVQIIEQNTNKLILTKVFMMPHHDQNRYWIDSNFIEAKLNKDVLYTILISDFYNMSYFEHFSNYHYRGGRSGEYNYANIAGLKLLFLKDDTEL